jgi:hypothetical protein
MKTKAIPQATLPFEVGEGRAFAGLTVVPLFGSETPALEYVGLDEAGARGFAVTEVDESGSVGTLRVKNPLDELVLLYEGEELVGAKQNRILARTILVEARSALEIPVACVEQGRWSFRSRQFAPAPRAAYPELRRARHASGTIDQGEIWCNVAAKQARFHSYSPTGAAESLYHDQRATLDEYVEALPRLDGQAGALIGIAGELVCLDYVGRSDVFAGLYLKLLRGYALDAIERPVEKRLRRRAVERFLAAIREAARRREPALALGEEARLRGRAVGSVLEHAGEVVALIAFPGTNKGEER